jgi:hypothetical protein
MKWDLRNDHKGVLILQEKQNQQMDNIAIHKRDLSRSRELVRTLLPLSGMEALNHILAHENPGHLIRRLSRVDLFWIVKKIGEDDALPILRLASNEQWEHFIDMEIWQRDRIDIGHTFKWLYRLFMADPERLTSWLYEEGSLLAYYYFLYSLQVVVKGDEDQAVPDGFFTLDNMYYIRILDKEHEEIIEKILRYMVQTDYQRYQALLLGLSGVLPDELEEEMYRLKGVRLAEVGYLPFEEAISVYSYNKADLLKTDESPYQLLMPDDEETKALVPIMPFGHTRSDNLLAHSIVRITDDVQSDRIRLEFAGLCNQILSADGTLVEDIKVLMEICRKAGGYLNLGLEKLSGGDIPLAEKFLINNPLISIFQAGFGLALELKWKVERWIKGAWFMNQGLTFDFWGDTWGPVLEGLIQKSPLFFSGLQENRQYRDFESFSEIEHSETIISRVKVLDTLIGFLYSDKPVPKEKLKDPLLTFHSLIFHLWAQWQLSLDMDYAFLSIEQLRQFFGLLRAGEKTPPFQMENYQDVFIKDLLSYLPDPEKDTGILLRETLAILWQEFVEEYAWVVVGDLDARFSRYFHIRPAF